MILAHASPGKTLGARCAVSYHPVMQPVRRLGRGLENLIPEAALTEAPGAAEIARLPVRRILPNPNQPRKNFPDEELKDLAASILESGVLQPIIVRPFGADYQILAGERRFRAAKLSGLEEIPVVIRQATDQEAIVLSLVENLQRADLDPIEKATAIRALLQKNSFTQEQAAKALGKDRSHVANILRLLDLPKDVQDIVSRGTLSMGHARAILGVQDPDAQRRIAAETIRRNLSVRNVEKLVQGLKPGSEWYPARGARSRKKPEHTKEEEDRLARALGLRVEIRETAKGRGTVVIHFRSLSDFDTIKSRLSP